MQPMAERQLESVRLAFCLSVEVTAKMGEDALDALCRCGLKSKLKNSE